MLPPTASWSWSAIESSIFVPELHRSLRPHRQSVDGRIRQHQLDGGRRRRRVGQPAGRSGVHRQRTAHLVRPVGVGVPGRRGRRRPRGPQERREIGRVHARFDVERLRLQSHLRPQRCAGCGEVDAQVRQTLRHIDGHVSGAQVIAVPGEPVNIDRARQRRPRDRTLPVQSETEPRVQWQRRFRGRAIDNGRRRGDWPDRQVAALGIDPVAPVAQGIRSGHRELAVTLVRRELLDRDDAIGQPESRLDRDGGLSGDAKIPGLEAGIDEWPVEAAAENGVELRAAGRTPRRGRRGRHLRHFGDAHRHSAADRASRHVQRALTVDDVRTETRVQRVDRDASGGRPKCDRSRRWPGLIEPGVLDPEIAAGAWRPERAVDAGAERRGSPETRGDIGIGQDITGGGEPGQGVGCAVDRQPHVAPDGRSRHVRGDLTIGVGRQGSEARYPLIDGERPPAIADLERGLAVHIERGWRLGRRTERQPGLAANVCDLRMPPLGAGLAAQRRGEPDRQRRPYGGEPFEAQTAPRRPQRGGVSVELQRTAGGQLAAGQRRAEPVNPHARRGYRCVRGQREVAQCRPGEPIAHGVHLERRRVERAAHLASEDQRSSRRRLDAEPRGETLHVSARVVAQARSRIRGQEVQAAGHVRLDFRSLDVERRDRQRPSVERELPLQRADAGLAIAHVQRRRPRHRQGAGQGTRAGTRHVDRDAGGRERQLTRLVGVAGLEIPYNEAAYR